MLFPLRISTGLSASSSSLSVHRLSWSCSRTAAATVKVPYCKSLRTGQDIPAVEYKELQSQLNPKNANGGFGETEEDATEPVVGGEPEGGGKGIRGIQVPRQRYIAVSKSELLDAILLMFEAQEEVDQFLLLSS